MTREVLVQMGHRAGGREDATTAAEISALEDGQECKGQLLQLRHSANELMDIDKHYQRKEHVLFSLPGKHGITGPSKVM